MKKTYKLLFSAALIIILLFVLATVLAVIFFPAEKVRELVQNKASEALDMPVSVGSIGLSFIGMPAIKASDIIIGPPEGQEKPLVTVASVKATINILKLLKKEVEIISVEFVSPDIHFVIPKIDTTLAEPAEDTVKPPGPPSLPLPVTLHTLEIRDGHMEIENRNNNTRILLDNISQKLSLDISSDLKKLNSSGVLAVDDISFSHGEARDAINGLKFRLEHELTGDITTGDFSISRCELSVNDLPVTMTGGVGGWTKFNFQLKTGNLNAEKFLQAIPLSLLPDKEKISTQGNFALTVEGTADTEPVKPIIAYNGSIDIDDMSLTYRGFPGSMDNISSHISFSEKDINIKDLSLNTGKSNFNLSGTVTSYPETPEMSLNVNGRIDMDDVTESLPVFEDKKVEGVVEINLSVKGSPPDVKSIKADGVLSFREFVVEIPEILRNPAKLNGS